MLLPEDIKKVVEKNTAQFRNKAEDMQHTDSKMKMKIQALKSKMIAGKDSQY